MNRSAEPALRSLLPTHNGPFPPQLTDLAGSLLAQSRHRASTLKADEEIARSYACAHIACDRLKTSLNLPPIEPRPPIQPRLYKRLYTHLNTILAPAPGARAAASSTRIDPGHSLRSPAPSGANTPRRVASTATNQVNTPSKSAAGQAMPRESVRPAAAASQFPPWVRPTVRYICHELGHPQLAPTIAAGLAAIHRDVAIEAKEKQNRPRRGLEGDDEGEEEDDDDDEEDMTEWLEDSLTALVAALYLYCMTSWREHTGTQPGGAGRSGLEERQFQLDEKAILGAFDKVRGVVGTRDDSAWEGWQDLQKRTFRDALVVVSKHQWLQSDWYQDIANLHVATSGGDGDAEGDGAVGDEEGRDGEVDDGDYGGVSIPTKVWRADSMFQTRYDFLSEAKQQEYEAWRKGMLEEISGLQQAQHQPQPMEVDS
ncbi:hypothetical protein HMPREF1624_08643 [Sporothrix schenckii ATCC 58251]|uniref:ORC6 first cyclin-like domain-containing protein n=1 Tax=Sporothrix schenckii (strain ATCC 58251 / de Perez 2211183) TaxID=1391915 RepID=U7PHE8_SPOS1|nr:hypothetical protein HMPREF1624_08643 [Sporothrix schenckii ATCC 58251]